MFRRVLPVLCLLALPVDAQDLPTCDPVRMDCSPLVVCIEATGERFRGASFGRDAGPFHMRSESGPVCQGQWSRTAIGIGLAEFSCADGRRGTSAFTWFEPETGTAVGSGRFADGTPARFGAGNNLARYFREVSPEDQLRMGCNMVALLS